MKYNIQVEKDVLAYIESKHIDLDEFAHECGITRELLYLAFKNRTSLDVLEKIYGHLYDSGFLLNKVKNELIIENKKKNSVILYHGSKFGFNKIDVNGSKEFSDFSNGFYTSMKYESALAFIEKNPNSSIYVFEIDTKDLNVLTLDSSLDWMILISYYRGYLNEYSNSKVLTDILKKMNDIDIVVAPIANNKMFQILSDFALGNITSSEAIHSLSASRLGLQYVFKSQRAINKLQFKERLYISDGERKNSALFSEENANLIESKLYLAKREYRNEGKFIEEILL